MKRFLNEGIQLEMFPRPKQEVFEDHLRAMGVDLRKYKSGHDVRGGKPQQGEKIALAFFPKLVVGLKTDRGVYVIELNNLEDPYKIDLRIVEVGSEQNPAGYLDVETRGEGRGDYPFVQSWADPSIPLHSHNSNWKRRKIKSVAMKVLWYRSHPKNSFDFKLRYNFKEAICCWAEDFIHLEPKPRQRVFGGDEMYEAPREKCCSGEIGEEAIENFVLKHLIEGGYIK